MNTERNTLRLTRSFIQSGSSSLDAGGWNKKQLAVLGIKWPPRRGWLSRLIGREVSQETADEFIRLKRVRKWEPIDPALDMALSLDDYRDQTTLYPVLLVTS